MSKSIFITGTGTDIGKTYVTGLLLKKIKDMGKNPAYYKAALSGNQRDENGILIPGDGKQVKEMANLQQDLQSMCPFVYEQAVSPHLATKTEGNPVELDVVKVGYEKLFDSYDYITLEGSGGILCPLRYDSEQKILLEDVIRLLDLDCIVVADAGLGTINSVVTTCSYLEKCNIPIKGIIFNHFHKGNVLEEDNLKMCQELTGYKVIACVEDHATELEIDGEYLLSLYK